ncbi:30S ribosomal protein S18 [Gordonia bronchialis]|uniref:30S ribosomal protein S18 n=1 Tax=Gordonia bronchialis TaxID=2054 RepID=UPI0037C06015
MQVSRGSHRLGHAQPRRPPTSPPRPVMTHGSVRRATFLSDRGKIRSRSVTGLTPQQQRQVATAIRNAREMALLPYGSR